MRAIDRFKNVHEEAIASNETKNMLIADCILRKAVELLSEYSEEDVTALTDAYEGAISYDNYLSETEARRIVNRLEWRNGRSGAMWDPGEFFEKVQRIGGEIDVKPRYNKWALWATANTISSDQQENIEKWAGTAENSVAMTYDFSVSQLSDKDRPHWIRWYFGL